MKKEKSTYKYLSEKDKKEISYLYWCSKQNLKQIAQRFDISPQTVTTIAQKFGNPTLRKNKQKVILVPEEEIKTTLMILNEYGMQYTIPYKFDLTYQIESKINNDKN